MYNSEGAVGLGGVQLVVVVEMNVLVVWNMVDVLSMSHFASLFVRSEHSSRRAVTVRLQICGQRRGGSRRKEVHNKHLNSSYTNSKTIFSMKKQSTERSLKLLPVG